MVSSHHWGISVPPEGVCTRLDRGGQIRGFHRWILSPLGAVVFRPLRAAFYGRVCDPGTDRPEPAGSALPSTLLLPTLLLCQKLLCISYTSEEARPPAQKSTQTPPCQPKTQTAASAPGIQFPSWLRASPASMEE